MQRLSRALLSQLVRSSPQAALHSSTAAGPTTAAAAAAAGASLFSIRWFSSSEGSQRLYIGNLSFDATQEDLMAAFEKYGPVHDMTLPRRPDGKHKGFGFVEVWSSLSEEERKNKETFYGSQQRTASGFMRYAKTTLDLLLTLTADRDIGRSFMVQPLLGRTAFAALHFLELLVGPRCQQLDVANPQRYNFDRQALLLTLVQLTGQLAQHAAFPQALSEEPDYEDSLLQTAIDLLNKQHAYAAADSLSAVLASISSTRARQAKKQRTGAFAPGEGGAAGSSDAGAGGMATGAALDAQIQGLLARWGQGLGDSPKTYEAAEQPYSQELEPLAVGVFDADAPGAYNSHFKTMANQQEGDSTQKLRRLGRELRDLRGKTKLPVAAAAACFVSQDADRPDKVRCIITGPQDTPYEGGLFVFDVFFPAGYPNVPPLMVLETTGDGRARFNPNLYADGKVCLSLLGTWHGGDEASKWSPSSSSLFQILLSIQGMIFVEDPYFNEPAVELMRGTSEGAIASMRYNSEVRLSTLRWAVLALLRKPPPGLQEVVKAHFRVLRGVLVARAGRWLKEAATADPSGTTFNRMVDVMGQIVEAAAAL